MHLVTGVVGAEPPTPVCVNLDDNAVEESSQSIITVVPADGPTQLTPLLDNDVRKIDGRQELKERFVGLQHGITSCLTFCHSLIGYFLAFARRHYEN
ncbi:hypothetical protein DAPPUDRAFT_265438 [Daphnia pulex]|uniref:Uncharacterized protein n=1 Tax=Daphnia pulex TaxID=6669 RepID=E9HTF7_DAPPU|nr:hypothetical protein DAPPUDRAFT_265438 [Daphnia pulex]|eukprot:EFX64975.1 hypothetical protein DAPPUDRAFT_265438 [Daphnia pulex]